MDHKKELVKILKRVDILENIDIENIIEEPKDRNNGDFALPCFIVAKNIGMDIKKVSNYIYNEINNNKLFNVISIGPFLNFKLKNEYLIKNLKNKNNLKNIGKNKKILIEYSSPNTNKAQHLGHLRNNILGVSLTNILKFCGYNVITSCIFNDKGLAMAKTIYGYIKFGNNSESAIGEKPDKFVGNFYVLACQDEKNDKHVKEEINEINRKWENGDQEIMQIWKKLTNWVYSGYSNTYNRLGCKFDKIYYESDIFKYGKEIVLDGFKKGIFKESSGAIVSNLEEYNLPDTILLKSDGTSLYITQDIYLAKLRKEQIRPQKTIYIVANEQNLYFKQLFAILEQLGIGRKEEYFHLNYGYISLPEGKMKSREGVVIDADDLMDEVVNNELEKLEDKDKKRAEIIGVGAIKFQFLKIDAYSDLVFDPKKSIELNGDTSVYLQYTYARIKSLLKKSKVRQRDFIKFNINNAALLKDEIDLMRELNFFYSSVVKGAENYNPSFLCKELINIANVYNNFYQKNKIINMEDKNLKNIRLFLSYKTGEYIKLGLKLLGIKTIDKI